MWSLASGQMIVVMGKILTGSNATLNFRFDFQGVDHFKKIQYADGITYGELFLENDVHHIQKHFDFFEEEARSLLASGLAIPAYDQLLKTSHAFNILDSRGFVGVTERARKTEYVYARVKESARVALKVLSEELPGILAKISFPKSMRWNSQIMFSRPIRWIMSLHGDAVVPFTFAGILSGNLSYGLRNTSAATVMVESAESYPSIMKNAGIGIEIEDRKKIILDHSNLLAKSVNGNVVIQESLLSEVVNLVEAPVPVLGKFKESFLELPDDLLTMVMQKHQKYFAITDDNGKLLPYFIAVANGAINEMVVRKGNEAVLRARYEDAKFFYELDTRKKFVDFRHQLKGILFHEKLGTMLDKMMRVENMVCKLSMYLGVKEDMLQIIKEAASLAMSDLATAVVTEFTPLSGIMARHYALRDGYSEQTAEALLEITLPRFSGDLLPKSDVGIVLAIADKLDSLVGLFAAGCQPSSTNDPFGLRRISYGLVQILVEKNQNMDLKHALELAADNQPIKVDATTIEDVHQFVTRRLEQYLVDKGISPEVVRSTLAERANLPCLAAKTACKMEALSKGNLFPKVVEAYSRPTRIVRGKDVDADMEVDDAAFETNEERALWDTLLSVKNQIHPGVEVDDFIEISSELVQPLEDFFNQVFVMVEDETIRKNRLSLLKKIADLPKEEMATMNPFDLLGDDDTGELSLLIAAQQKAVAAATNTASAAAPKKGPAQSQGKQQQPAIQAKPAKLPSKPLPPAQAVREATNEGPRGGGRGGRGFGRGRGGSGGYRRDSASDETSFSNSAVSAGQGAPEEGESGKPSERRSYGGPRPYRGGRRGGFSNGEVGQGERPRRMYERHSGTGRGNELKREGSGRGNWGTQTDELAQVTEEVVNESEKNLGDEKPAGEEDAGDASKESPTNEPEEKEPEDKEMTLEEYEKVLEEKRKALQALKTEERKVDAKEFATMQQLSNKKSNDEVFIKLGSEKDKRKEAFDKEERAKKSVSINEFLKPAEGERYYNPSGRGRGRGRGSRGFGGGSAAGNVSAPSIEDPGQFPTLGGKIHWHQVWDEG
ncbi:Glycine-tRNA ligase [Theobroma cacao]|nr:Glycine-tRNA ligase [Theobroma cacao]